MVNYDLTEANIAYIEINFRKKDKILLSEIRMHDNITHIDNIVINNNRKILTIPVSINEDTLGELLNVDIKDDLIVKIILNINNKNIYFLDLILKTSSILPKNHMDKITSFDSVYKYYLVKKELKNPFGLAIKFIDKHSIDKIMFSLGGVVINRITDIFHEDYIERISGSKTIIIKNDKMIKSEQTISLKPIPKPKKIDYGVEDSNVGVIDTETYIGNDGSIKLYSLGFKTILYKNVVMYYIDKETKDHTKLVITFINELLRSKYSNIRFYCHNLGGYSIVFLLKIIYTFNENISDETKKYKITLTLRDNKGLKCVISRGKQHVVLIYSFPILLYI
jgi:hypothetical protein